MPPRAVAAVPNGPPRTRRGASATTPSGANRYLDELAACQAEAWHDVEALIAATRPKDYDRAVGLLIDPRDLGLRDGRAREVAARIGALGERHARKHSFVQCLKKAGLVQTGA